MKPNTISCILPTYKRPDFVFDRVKELNNQTGNFKIQLVIVEDGTNDIDEPFLKTNFLNLDIRVIKLHKNSGSVTIPRNIGIDNSDGDYIAHVDDDVINLPHKFSLLFNSLSSNPDKMLCHGKRIENKNQFRYIPQQPELWDPLKGWGVDGGQFMYRRSIYDKIPYVFSRRGCDWELAKAICNHYGSNSIMSVNDIVSEYLWHKDNRSLDDSTKFKSIYPIEFEQYFKLNKQNIPNIV